MKHLKLYENYSIGDFVLVKYPLQLNRLSLLDLGYSPNGLEKIEDFITNDSVVKLVQNKNGEYMAEQIFSNDRIMFPVKDIIKELTTDEVLEEIEKIEKQIEEHIEENILIRDTEKNADKFNL